MKIDDRLLNGEPFWSAYMHSKGTQLGLPIAGTFEITPRCNFNCKMCYIHQQADKPELSADEWLDIGRQAAACGMIFILITGGEPLIRPDFPKIYKGLKELGLLVSVNTNGSLITDEVFDMFVSDPPNRINISLYGGSDDTYMKLCGNAKYSVVTGNIRRLKEAGISMRINASFTPENASDIKAVYDFAKEMNLPVQSSTYMYPPIRVNADGFGVAPNRFGAEEAAKYMLTCREQIMTPEQLLKSIEGIGGMHEECTGSEGEPMHCRAGRTSFWATWDGRLLPCAMFSIEGYDIRKLGFAEAWKCAREFTNTVRLPSECAACSHNKDCCACASSCVAETGSFDKKPEYVCTFTKTFHELIRQKYSKEETQNED